MRRVKNYKQKGTALMFGQDIFQTLFVYLLFIVFILGPIFGIPWLIGKVGNFILQKMSKGCLKLSGIKLGVWLLCVIILCLLFKEGFLFDNTVSAKEKVLAIGLLFVGVLGMFPISIKTEEDPQYYEYEDEINEEEAEEAGSENQQQ